METCRRVFFLFFSGIIRKNVFITQLFVPQACHESSQDRRAEPEVRLAVPSAQKPAEWRIL